LFVSQQCCGLTHLHTRTAEEGSWESSLPLSAPDDKLKAGPQAVAC
jgi:hypothetical protein